MPAYSFKERFIPMILDGTKRQTIRKRRLKGFAKIGDTLYLYFGLRTKFCRKLGEEICTDVRTIHISAKGEVHLYNKRLSDYHVSLLLNKKLKDKGYQLTDGEKMMLAYRDGFRTGNMVLPADWELMLKWWKQTHTLPFIGDIIYW